MARIVDPDSDYRVSIHINRGYRYASTQPRAVNPKTGRETRLRLHWGTVDKELKFTPGSRYWLTPPKVRARLIFPKEWDISAIYDAPAHLPGRQGAEAYEDGLLYGDIWLCERACELTGLREDLLRALGGDVELSRIVLTLAIYLVCREGSYSRLARHQRYHRFPAGRALTMDLIYETERSLDERARAAFLRARAARLKKGPLYVAATSALHGPPGRKAARDVYGSTYQRQSVEVAAYTPDEHLPVYCRVFPRGIGDPLAEAARELEDAGAGNLVFVLGGTGPAALAERLPGRRICGAGLGSRQIMRELRAMGPFNRRPPGMDYDADLELWYKRCGPAGGGDGLNLYLDTRLRCRNLLRLDREIQAQRQELERLAAAGTPVPRGGALRGLYPCFEVRTGGEGGTVGSFALRERCVERLELAAGFSALITRGAGDDPAEAWRHYGLRGRQERYFSNLKNTLESERHLIAGVLSETGRVFILHAAMLMECCLEHVSRAELSGDFGSAQDLLDEMRDIRYAEKEGRPVFTRPLTGAQRRICAAFGLRVPDGPDDAGRPEPRDNPGPGRSPRGK